MTDRTTLTLPNLAATMRFAQQLAPQLRGGDLLLLDGVVGAGKTTLARALIQALLGAEQEVPSPTFTLVQEYALPSLSGGEAGCLSGARLLHYDLYRLVDPEELEELAWADVGREDTVALVEWPNRLAMMPPGNVLHLQIALGEIPEDRQLELHAYGDWVTRIGLLSL